MQGKVRRDELSSATEGRTARCSGHAPERQHVGDGARGLAVVSLDLQGAVEDRRVISEGCPLLADQGSLCESEDLGVDHAFKPLMSSSELTRALG